MSTDRSLEETVREWQLKNKVADDDPVMIMLALTRLTLRQACTKSNEGERIPSYGEYRETVEMMDNRSKVFVNQSRDLLDAMRLVVPRLRQRTFALALFAAAFGFITGLLTVFVLV